MAKPRGFDAGFSGGFGVGRYYYGFQQYEWFENSWVLPASVVGAVDLRPLSAMSAAGGAPQGYAFVASMQPINVLVKKSLHFSDENATGAMQDAWESTVGYRPSGTKVVDLLWDQLTNGADPTGEDGCKPLVAGIDGVLRLFVGGHSQVKRERFKLGKHTHTNRLLDVVKRDLMKVREESHAGLCITSRGVDYEFHRRVMQAAMEKYRCTFEALRPAGWPENETPLPHLTVITDTFNRTDADALGTASGGFTWTETSGDVDIVSNKARVTASSGTNEARAETDLSSSDNYAQVTLTLTRDVASQGGPSCRFSSSARDYYWYRNRDSSIADSHQLYKVVTGTGTQLSTENVSWVNGTVCKVSASGSSIKGYRGGTEDTDIAVTDTAITVGLRSGFSINPDNANSEVDDFEAGDLGTKSPPPPHRLTRFFTRSF